VAPKKFNNYKADITANRCSLRIPISKLIFCCLLSFCSIFCISSKAYASVQSFSFDTLTKADGLPQDSIFDITEDKQGFIWFATGNGLSRFDGYNLVNYQHNADDSHSIPHDFIRKLLIDVKGVLWLGTQNGVARYDVQKDNFIRYNQKNSALVSNLITTLSLDHNNNLLVADESNLYTYNENSDDFTIVKVNGAPMPAEIKYVLSEADRTWIGSYGHGIYVLEHKTNTLYNLNGPNPWNITIPANYLFELKKYDDQYWFATEAGAFVWNSSTNSLKHYSTDTQPALTGNEIRSIERDLQGNIWLGSSTGISILDVKLQTSHFVFASDDPTRKVNRYILKMYKDSHNSIWLGSLTGGVFKYNHIAARIKHFTFDGNDQNSLSGNVIWAIREDSQGEVWLATQGGGLNKFNSKSYEFEHYLEDFEHSIWDLAIDSQDRLWVASNGGIYVYDQAGDSALELITIISKGNFIEKLLYTENSIWLKSKDNVLRWIDETTFEMQSVSLPAKKFKSLQPTFLDSANNLWLQTDSGLSLYNLDTKKITQPIPDSEINQSHLSAIIETSDSFWLASVDYGLLKLNNKNYQIEAHLDTDNGLPRNQVLMGMHSRGNLWITTMGGGIEQIALNNGKVVQHISSERLNYNDFNEGSGLITRDNQVLFGGSKGFHMFEQDLLAYKPVKGPFNQDAVALPPPPIISQLRIFNREMSVHSVGSPLDKPIHLTHSVTLPNSANHISLTFGQLNAIEPKAYSYRYKLKGASKNWLDADKRTREATFTNLDFGQYDFLVQSRNNLGPWSQPAQLQINIEPPIWLHRNAIMLYLALILMISLLMFKQYRSRRKSRLAITQSEERLKLTLWSSGDELWDWDIYQSQVFRSNTWGVLDFPQDDIRVNSAYQANIHQNDIKRVQDALNEHLQDKSEHYEVTYRARTFKGDWLWILDRGKVVNRDNNHQPLRMTGTLKNISHLKVAEEQLKLFKRSIETISDGVFIADMGFKFISVNKAYCKYTGETREQALASYLTFHQYPGAFTEEVKKSLRQKGNWLGEVESRRVNGDKYELELNIDAINDEDGRISHYVGVFSDITSRKSTEKELLKLANTDPLTDLPNRSFFQASHSNTVRRGTQHSLICLDMDNFKKINDSLGHQTGDILIKQIAKRLQKIAGTHATCYRLGGDEFSILVDKNTDVHQVTHLAQTVLDDMARPFLINNQEFVLGASIGIAFYPEDGSSPQELLKNADTAMYFAKNAGGNKYQFFSGEMNQHAVRQLQIENLIRLGLKEDLFTVYYQPKIDIATGKLVSMEALVRFEHPEKGIVSPAQFIPLAEQTGQVVEIGEVVLRKACADTKRWVSQGLFSGRVAVNISARQFELPDLDEKIEQILRDANLSPLHLECEITEGTLMQDPENALRMMNRLRERGIHLALDDFGTGYSSLAYLKRFPLNTLKIDKAFIDDIATSSVDRHMTAAIITIAHNLGLKVVAEGVEHEEQMSILRRFECEMLQGYLYSKPLSSARFERLLKENHELNRLIRSSKA
jgi:diguanylate cyclase (GGDEF)-like protein/PAS domain S-box-containing protein